MLQDELSNDLRQKDEKQTIKYGWCLTGENLLGTQGKMERKVSPHTNPSPIPCQQLMGLFNIPGTHILEYHVKAVAVSGCLAN